MPIVCAMFTREASLPSLEPGCDARLAFSPSVPACLSPEIKLCWLCTPVDNLRPPQHCCSSPQRPSKDLSTSLREVATG